MKKINFLPLLVCLIGSMIWSLTSCDIINKPDDTINSGNNENGGKDPTQSTEDPVDTLMTPDESKKYLMNAGKELLNAFSTTNQKNAVDILEDLAWKQSNFEWDYTVFADYATKDIDDMFSITKYIRNVANGTQSPTESIIYTYSFARQAAIFEANETTYKWEKKSNPSNNGVILRMKSKLDTEVEAKCWGEGTTRSYSYSYYVGEEGEEHFTTLSQKYTYVGYDYQWNSETYTYDYIYYGNYKQEYDNNTYQYIYTYVGEGKGDYAINENAVTYVWVGENHGSYEYSSNPNYSGNEDDLYEWVGTNKGSYARLTAKDANYRRTNSGYWSNNINDYVYDTCGCYCKYVQYYTRIREQSFDGAEKRTITVELPEKVRFTLKEDDNLIADFTQTFDLVQNDHYKLSTNLSFTNLQWNQETDITYQSAKASVEMKYGDKTLVAAKVTLPSFEMIKQQDGELYSEYGERVEDRWESLVNEVGQVTTEVNLIDRVQIKARVSNVGDLYNAYLDWEDAFGSRKSMTYQAANGLKNVYKSYCVTGIYYNSSVAQAQMDFDIYASGGESGSYEIEPVLYFPGDGSKYSYSSYFSERRFGNLIDLTEDVANSYIRLLKLFDVNTIDLR